MIRLARLCTPTIVVGLVMVFAAGSASAQSSDPMNGTWKLDPAKSTYSPGPKPQSVTLVIEGTDAAHKITVDQTPAAGAARHYSVSGAFGKELPVVGGTELWPTVSRRSASVFRLRQSGAQTQSANFVHQGQ